MFSYKVCVNLTSSLRSSAFIFFFLHPQVFFYSRKICKPKKKSRLFQVLPAKSNKIPVALATWFFSLSLRFVHGRIAAEEKQEIRLKIMARHIIARIP